MREIPIEPTSEQCSSREQLSPTDWACWYPQMGGYVGKAVVRVLSSDTNSCFDVWVWHDGEFPFSGEAEWRTEPVELHHCNPEQFIWFGKWVQGLMSGE